MIDAFRPWIGLAIGIMLTMRGLAYISRPSKFAGVGLIAATDPRTVRIFGGVILVIGLLSAGINIPPLLTE